MMMRIFLASSLMKFTSSLSDLSVDWEAAATETTSELHRTRLRSEKQEEEEKEKEKKGGGADLLDQPLQLVGELAEVAGGDESEAALLQAVAGQLDDLVVGKAEHAVRQREDALRGAAADHVLDPFLHLSRGLAGASKGDCEGPFPGVHGRGENTRCSPPTFGKRSL